MSGVGTTGVATITGVSDSAGVGSSGVIWAPGGAGFSGTPTTWNPSDVGANLTLSSGDLVVTASLPSWRSVRAVGTYKSTGKYYFEASYSSSIDTGSDGFFMIGVATSALLVDSHYLGINNLEAWGYQATQRKTWYGGTTYGPALPVLSTVRFGILTDLDNDTLEFTVNGASQGVAFSDLTGKSVLPACSVYTDAALRAYFDPTTWQTTPAGYLPWTT